MSNCRNCPYISLAGQVGAKSNCIKSAIKTYNKDYEGQTAYFLRIQGVTLSHERVYVCCQGGVAYREPYTEEIEMDHHVLLVEYSEGGFFTRTYYDLVDVHRKDIRLKSKKEAYKILKDRYGPQFEIIEEEYCDYQELLVRLEDYDC